MLTVKANIKRDNAAAETPVGIGRTSGGKE